MAFPAGFTLATAVDNEDALELPISSLTLAIADGLELDVGAATWTVLDSATEHWQKKAVVIEAAASTATVVKAQMIRASQMWIVETANNSAAADNGDRMLATDQNTINNSGTDSTAEEAIFVQYKPVGAAADKRILGWFVEGSGVNPDAA